MQDLRTAYDAIFRESQPEWAQTRADGASTLPPTIPFVGKEYHRFRVLLYASAENLSRYTGYLEKDDVAIADRHRWYFAQEGNRTRFFPFVHCTPINDGSLATAAAYICPGLGIPVCVKMPKDFLECIAFANFGKFSIGAQDALKRNRDYAGDLNFLRESLEYIEADLRALAPGVVIMPKRIYDHDAVRDLLARCAPNARCIPIYQINAGNVNRIIRRRYPPKPIGELTAAMREWYAGIAWSGKSKENYLSVFTYLDDVLRAGGEGLRGLSGDV